MMLTRKEVIESLIEHLYNLGLEKKERKELLEYLYDYSIDPEYRYTLGYFDGYKDSEKFLKGDEHENYYNSTMLN